MAALITLIGEAITFISRLFFLLKDAWNIFKWNFLFLTRVVQNFFPFIKKWAAWLFEFVVHTPGLVAEGALLQFAKWINLALAASCCGFIADAVSFPQVVQGVNGLAYFAAPWRLEYGIGCILCALMVRFLFKWVPHIPIPRLPRLPGVKWPQLPGGGS
jgi:hypothetical protein